MHISEGVLPLTWATANTAVALPFIVIKGARDIMGTTGLVHRTIRSEDEGLKKAVMLLGHGSRATEANDGMYQTIEMVKQLTGLEIVEPGFMGLNPPSIFEGAAACVARGATKIVMIPYFLHLGNHGQRDLPNTLAELKQRYPDVEFTLGQHIGFHPELAKIIAERIQEADGGDGEIEKGA